MTDKILDMMRELLAVPCPSGREEGLAAALGKHLDALGYEHKIDPSGNVVVALPGRETDAPALMLAAHMDEIGMVVTAIDDDGSLHVDRSGGLFPYKLGERPVTVVGDHDTVVGVVSMGSTHTANASERSVQWPDVRIMTGLSPDELATRGIRVGSTAVPTVEQRGPVQFGNADDPLVGAWTFDDRGGIITLLCLLEQLKANDVQPRVPMYIAFTVHEEGGCHGAKALAQRLAPEIFVAIDGCPMPPDQRLTLDGRPAIWSKDKLTHYDQRLVRDFHRAAADAGIGLQTAVLDMAFSDASAVYACGAAPRVATIGHVRENSHGFEVARLSVFDNVLKILLQFIKDF